MSFELPLCKACGKEMFIQHELVAKSRTDTVISKCLVCSICGARGPVAEGDGREEGFIIARAIKSYLRPYDLYDEMVTLLGEITRSFTNEDYQNLIIAKAASILERLDLSHARKVGLEK